MAGQTLVLVGKDKQILGAVALADQLRAEAKQAVEDLKQAGYHIVLMTGDTSGSAKAIGSALGVHETMGDLLPHQKLERIQHSIKMEMPRNRFRTEQVRIFTQPNEGLLNTVQILFGHTLAPLLDRKTTDTLNAIDAAAVGDYPLGDQRVSADAVPVFEPEVPAQRL